MVVREKNGGGSERSEAAAEKRFRARSVSRGIGMGKAVCLHGRKRQFYRIDLKPAQIEREVRRFQAAVRLARLQLKRIGASDTGDSNSSAASIFSVHLMMLEDSSLVNKVEEIIREEQVNAEWAVKLATDTLGAAYKSIENEHLREKYIDLEDVAERIMTALGGRSSTRAPLEKGSVIVAREVRPSTLLELIKSDPKAIITEQGGWTSHTFILAREANLPAVTGVKNVLRAIKTGDDVVVDGYSGQVVLSPSRDTLRKYRPKDSGDRHEATSEPKPATGPVRTLDGHEIIIRANVDMPGAYREAQKFGARGVGLYRSEFLFNQYKGFPSEGEQIKAYCRIGKLAGENGVRVRTFDLSVEQMNDQSDAGEKNPALGLRAIRLSLSRRPEFRKQLRALLQASAHARIDIVLPMVTDTSEIIQTRKLLEVEKAALKRKGIEFGEPRLGSMIETPAAVLIVEELAEVSDFLSLGTNDLIQYILAVDRDNSAVSDWFRTMHPAVIRAVSAVIHAAKRKGMSAIVCGEMAGSAFYVPVLIGLGATELSMNSNSIGPVRKVIGGIAFEEAALLAREVAKARTSDEAEDLLKSAIREKWVHLFPERSFLYAENRP